MSEREILFRGKRVDNGEWVDGCLLIDYVSGQYFIHAEGNSINKSDKVNEEGCLKFFAYEVDPKTVCQYTGLTDKNGRRIFEGDIIKVTDRGVERGTGDVSLEDGQWYVNGELQERIYWLDDYIDYEFEVIGNIFDNPELIV